MAVLKRYNNNAWEEIITPSVNVYSSIGNYNNISGQAQVGEALMNVLDLSTTFGLAFNTTNAGGTVYISWGDGVIDTVSSIPAYSTQSSANALTAQVTHTYSANNLSGLGKWIPELGLWSYTIRVYGASSAIKYMKFARITSQYNQQNTPIVWAEINMSSLVDISQMFSNGVSLTHLRSPFLKKVNLYDCSNVVTSDYFAYGCQDFNDYNFPLFPLATSRTYALYGTGFTTVTFSNFYTGASQCSMTYFMASMPKLRKVIFTATNWGSVSNIQGLFSDCPVLEEITFPAGVGNNKLTTFVGLAQNCYNLKKITNEQYIGSTISATSGTSAFSGCENLAQTITINALLSRFTAVGSTNYKVGITGLRLTNASSTFGGTASQIDVSYCNLSASALNQLFTDLPTVSGKSIKITGCTGAGTCDATIATNKGWTVVN